METEIPVSLLIKMCGCSGTGVEAEWVGQNSPKASQSPKTAGLLCWTSHTVARAQNVCHVQASRSSRVPSPRLSNQTGHSGAQWRDGESERARRQEYSPWISLYMEIWGMEISILTPASLSSSLCPGHCCCLASPTQRTRQSEPGRVGETQERHGKRVQRVLCPPHLPSTPLPSWAFGSHWDRLRSTNLNVFWFEVWQIL